MEEKEIKIGDEKNTDCSSEYIEDNKLKIFLDDTIDLKKLIDNINQNEKEVGLNDE